MNKRCKEQVIRKGQAVECGQHVYAGDKCPRHSGGCKCGVPDCDGHALYIQTREGDTR